MKKRLARHEIAGFKLARIATDMSVAGHGLGGQLLAAEAGGVLLIIDTRSEPAAKWCASYGAEPLENQPLALVMPLAPFAADLKARGLL